MCRIQGQAGFALVAALTFLLMVTVLVGTAFLAGLSSVRLSVAAVQEAQARAAAEAGIEEAVADFWLSPLDQGIQADLGVFRTALDRRVSPSVPGSLSGRLADGSTFEVQIVRRDLGAETRLEVRSTGYGPAGARRGMAEQFVIGTDDDSGGGPPGPRLMMRRSALRTAEELD